MEQKTLHIVSHSHWDREWYMSFEQHRMRLVELFDTLIETMENHPEYKYYHMDGQYVVIEDYLEVRPQMKDRLFKLIQDDRIQIGPWYVLQDEYLTSGEANVRNMLYGIKLCKSIGADPVMCGYFPDAFGNISQAPQILQGFDIDTAAFGRGVRAILENNTVDGSASVNPSEIIWRSPDGSEVVGVMFVAWYHNSMELPTTKPELKEKLDKTLENLVPSAATPHLLGLNGCDHQPVQTNVYDAIELANEIYKDEYKVIHSNFKDYINAVRPYKDSFPLQEGEINGQQTKGEVPLIDTASTHVPLKQRNHRGQNALERIAEPLSVIAMHSGDKYRYDELFYAWRTLMQNHPHDSICSCSCDDVTREMVTRFEKSYQAAKFVADEAMDGVVRAIDTNELAENNIVVFHTSPFKTTDTVTAFVDFPEKTDVTSVSVTDRYGNDIPCSVKDLGRTFTYTLPKDSFRKPRHVKRFEVTMLITAEGIGYNTYLVQPVAKKVACELQVTENGAENKYLSFVIEQNGSLTITDKRSGRVYNNNNIYEDLGDVGESYNFRPVKDDVAITTANDVAKIWLAEQTDLSVTFGIENHIAIPVGAVNKLRTTETIDHTITTFVTLKADVARIDVNTKFNNQSENHRFRALFQPEIVCDTCLAEGQFDVVDREVVPHKNWQNPCYCQRIQAFIGLQDKNDGMGFMVAVRGINEYEVLRDGQNTLALTLLRCVAELGDWGYFPTPDAQCKGDHSVFYSIIPFAADTRADAYHQGFIFNGDPLHAVATGKHNGSEPVEKTLVMASGDYMSFAAFKKAEADDDAVLRFYNADRCAANLTLTFPQGKQSVYAVNLAEQHPEMLNGDEVSIQVPCKKIVSYKIRF